MTAPQKSVLTLKRAPRDESTPALEERLHKVLANAGLGSRRMLEQRIQAGEVELNGSPATIGASARTISISSTTIVSAESAGLPIPGRGPGTTSDPSLTWATAATNILQEFVIKKVTPKLPKREPVDNDAGKGTSSLVHESD